jgi:hypothetical protein
VGSKNPDSGQNQNLNERGQKMKKVLLSTTAVALVGAIALPASAAEWNMRVGGYSEQYVAYADNDIDNASGDYNGIDQKSESEIWFLASITLDNGIKIGANVQLEGFSGSDQIDENHMFIKGSFGEVILGSENSAGYKMTYAAPDVTFLNVNSGSLSFFVPHSGTVGGVQLGSDVFRRTLGTTYLENSGNNDAQRFTYFTPRFSGLQVGVSYARDGQQDTNFQVDDNVENDDFPTDIFDVGANYVNSFGDFDVAVSGRWGTGNDHSGSDATIWSSGINLGYSGFTVGGSYAEQNGNSHRRRNGQSYDIGASYETGPWGVSVTYFHGENQDNDTHVINEGTDDEETVGLSAGTDEELTQIIGGVNYKVAKGVRLNAFVAYVDFDEDVSDDGTGNGDDVEAFVVGTGIRLDF